MVMTGVVQYLIYGCLMGPFGHLPNFTGLVDIPIFTFLTVRFGGIIITLKRG
jgi:hypothetical protein